MKLSLRWLSRHLDLSGIEPRQILADLTMSTAEIESIEPYGHGLLCIVVGHVLSREKHPDADKLSVCMVDIGAGAPVQIVCGASNVAQGQKVAVIRPGDSLPAHGGKGGLKIKVGKIRGAESHGMICSEQELGLSDDQDGILVLPADAIPGASFYSVLPLQDWVFEIDNKSINHRPDLWGHYGFARELAAIYGRPLKALPPKVVLPSSGKQIAVTIAASAASAACPRYCGLWIDAVRADRSPPELRYLLLAVGQRAINLPVDLTNFVMHDLGQPVHAFDAAHLVHRSILVRMAKAGELMTTLDGQERKLQTTDLLICAKATGDHEGKPEALAGIMGGAGTMVGATTTSLFLESANFHAATIRRASVRLGIRTDASARFEKSQDPANAEIAVHHFLRLLQHYCPSAKAAGPLSDPAPFHYSAQTITLRRARLDLKLGIALPSAQVAGILTSLAFLVTENAAGFLVTVPSFRATKDIAIEDDLIEEVGRMFRYDNIPEVPLQSVVLPPIREEELFLVRSMLQLGATELGASEAYNYSFVPDALLESVGAKDHAYVQVQNPVAPEITRIRRHVLPSLLGNLRANLRKGNEILLMEHGKGYQPEVLDEHRLPREVREVAFAWSRTMGVHPYGELRERVLQLLHRLRLPVTATRGWQAADQPWVHPKMAAALDRAGESVGYVAHLHPVVARALELPVNTAIAMIDIRALLLGGRAPVKFQALPTFPELPVDVALLVPIEAKVHELVDFIRQVGRKLVRDVKLFEAYRGASVPAGKKSLNFTVVLGAEDRTLSVADESKFIEQLRKQAGEIGAELRG